MSVYQEAVMFFDNGQVIKEMLYPEFEAVLDNVVGLSDLAGRELNSAFVQIDREGRTLGVTLFKVSFLDNGSIPAEWNIPLRNLLEQSTVMVSGEDGHRVRWVSSEQCPVDWHAENLWHTDQEVAVATIAAAVKRNKLGLAYGRDEPSGEGFGGKSQAAGGAGSGYSGENQGGGGQNSGGDGAYREKLQQREQQFKVELASMEARYQERLVQQDRRFLDKAKSLEARFRRMKEALSSERRRNERLGSTLERAAEDLSKGRKDMERQLLAGQQGDAGQLASLRQQFENELEQQLSTQAVELEEKLRLRDSEIRFRDEEIKRLKAALERQEGELARLQESGGNELLASMVEHGVEFVSMHPGTGMLRITLAEMPDYLQRPEAFVAARCGTTPEQYRAWLVHHRDPCCKAILDDGKYCNQPLTPIDKPAGFNAGESDRCSDHRGAGG